MNVPLLRDPEPGDLLKQVRLLGQPVSDEALDLLRERRRIRRRAAWCVVPSGLLVVACFVVGFRQMWSGGSMVGYLVAADLIAVAAILVRHEVIRRAERDFGAYLPRRLTRPQVVSIRTVFGPWILVMLIAVVVLHIAMISALFAHGDAPAGFCFTLICAASYVLAAVALAQVNGRAVLAVDPLTLTVDDRLRTRDACTAYAPVFMAAALFIVLAMPSADPTLVYLGLGVNVLMVIDGVIRESRWSQVPSWAQQRRHSVGRQ